MSYTPTVWSTGDIVSSQKLNKLEEGVKNAYEVIVINGTVTYDDRTQAIYGATMETTAAEIYNAAEAGKLLIFAYTSGTSKNMAIIDSVSINQEDDSYSISVNALGIVFHAEDGNSNPTYGQE